MSAASPSPQRTSHTCADSSPSAVSDRVRQLVRECHRLGILYASEDWSPLSDITLGLLLERAGIRWRYCDLEHVGEIVWPPVCGVHLMQVNRQQSPGERRLAIRHGLAHVLAGDVAELTFAREGHDWRGREETVADLFALVDLIPDRQLAELRAAGYAPDELARWVYCEIARYAPRWPTERIGARAQLRLEG